ncbi:MAG TPA: hypothetical protein VNK91_01995 [Burkholderiaceae bacterium]|nr:hypothetical protein [Burkholderiaceae bacterium]
MAVRNYAKTGVPLGDGRYEVAIVTWSGLIATPELDTGQPFEAPHFADRSVQILGVLGVGGNVVIEGSNDGVNYATLTDPQGNPLTFNAINRLEAVTELTRHIRPRVTAGDGSTSFTVVMLVRLSP